MKITFKKLNMFLNKIYKWNNKKEMSLDEYLNIYDEYLFIHKFIENNKSYFKTKCEYVKVYNLSLNIMLILIEKIKSFNELPKLMLS